MKYMNAARVLPPNLLAMIRRFATGLIWVPDASRNRIKTASLPARNEAIRLARAGGESLARLAKKYVLSPTRISEICRGIKSGRRRQSRRCP